MYSCRNNNSDLTYKQNHEVDIKKLEINKKIDFPKSLISLDFRNPNKIQIKSKFTIVAYYDGNCATCYYQLLKWYEFIKKNNKFYPHTSFKFILSGYSSAVLKANIEDIGFPLKNVYHDKKDDFIKKHSFLLDDNYTNSSILLDQSNKVLCIGNPTLSKVVENKFMQLINE